MLMEGVRINFPPFSLFNLYCKFKKSHEALTAGGKNEMRSESGSLQIFFFFFFFSNGLIYLTPEGRTKRNKMVMSKLKKKLEFRIPNSEFRLIENYRGVGGKTIPRECHESPDQPRT